jgi:hypothetical protein
LAYKFYELEGYNKSGDLFPGVNYQCETIAKQAFHITSTKDITVYAHEQASTTSESLTALPTDALGNEYLVLAYNSDGSSLGGGVDGTSTPSQFAIIASEDSTSITITPSCPTRVNKSKVQNIILNRGDVYLVQADITYGKLNNDLTGTKIDSDKPIVVISGHQRASVPVNAPVFSRDCLLEQLPPISAWGRNAIVTPFAQSNTITTINVNDIFRVMVASDNTEIFVDGTTVGTYNSGEIFEYELTEPHYIEANAPILVCQYKKSAKAAGGNGIEQSDPLMMIIPPIEQFGNFYRIANMQSYETEEMNSSRKFPVYNEHYVNIIIKDSLVGEVMIDGNKINKSFFKKVPNTQYSYSVLIVQEGTHELKAPTGFGLNVYGYGYANSYGYYGGMNLTKYDYRPPQVDGKIDCFTVSGYMTDSTEIDTKIVTCEVPAADLTNMTVNISNEPLPAPVKFFNGELINKFEDGSFKIKVVDSTGLFTTKTYDVPGFTVGLEGFKGDENQIKVIVDTIPADKEVCWDFVIENYGKFEHKITQMYLNSTTSNDTLFIYIPFSIKPGQKLPIQVCKTLTDTGYYEFNLYLEDTCTSRTQVQFRIYALKDLQSPQLQDSKNPCNTQFYVNISEPLKSDRGIADFVIINEENGKIEITNPDRRFMSLYFKVIDSRKDAYFKFKVTDSAGNSTEYEKIIPGFTLAFSANPIDSIRKVFLFGERMIGTRHLDSLTVTNYGKYTIILENPRLDKNLLFSLPQSQFPMTIPSTESRTIKIIYKPISVQKFEKLRDRDTLTFTMNCIDEKIPLEGIALEFDVQTDSKCNVPIRLRTDSIPTSLEAEITPSITEGKVEISIIAEESSFITLNLYNQMGKSMMNLFSGQISEGKTERIFDLSQLPNDVYFVEIKTNLGNGFVKLIKVQ